MLDGQFNPFIRESTPPVVINIKVKTHEDWGWVTVGFIPMWTLKRAWAEIDLEVIDIAKFYVTVKISPKRTAEFEGEGHEWFKAELDLYFLELAGKYKVRIEMVDFAGNELDPPYEEEVDGWFGGVLRFLEDLWALGQKTEQGVKEISNRLSTMTVESGCFAGQPETHVWPTWQGSSSNRCSPLS